MKKNIIERSPHEQPFDLRPQIDTPEIIINDLIRTLDAYESNEALVSCQGQSMDGYSALANFVDIAKRAKCQQINSLDRQSMPSGN